MSEKSKILLVDDKPENLIAYEEILSDLDVDILKADGANQAMKVLLYGTVALIILDVEMPEMDGYELATILRRREETKSIPIMFVTGIFKGDDSIFKGYELGAVDYLIKPIDITILLHKAMVFVQLDQQKKALEHNNELLQTEISRRVKVEMKMQMATMVYENAVEGIVITDSEANILFTNPAFTHITGYEQEEAIGKNPRILKSDMHDDDFFKNMWDSLIEKGHWKGEIWNRRKNGEAYPEWLSISAIKNPQDKIDNFVAVFHDITEIKERQEKIEHMAYHDPLTALPNRQLFYDRISVAIKHSQRNKLKISVLFIDLDNFKKINDSYGHAVGDMLLKQVAQNIKHSCRSDDTVARIGGDEFAALLPEIETEKDIIEIAKRIVSLLAQPYEIEGHKCYIGASIGITVYPTDGKTPDDLIKNADIAMYSAKTVGKNRYHFFKKEMNEEVTRQIDLENKLRKGWKKKEVAVYYQPKVNLNSGKICGLEALLRWDNGEGTLISPATIIPIAEKTGLITKIDEWVLRDACKYLAEGSNEHLQDKIISVNLSAINFSRKNLANRIFKITEEMGVSQKNIELEITESILIHNVEVAKKILNEMSNVGLRIAMDDFGKGHSSLNYLMEFPFSTVKIDKSFVDNLATDSKSRAITKAIINLAHDMEMKVLAEGVEKQDQLDILYEFGCDEIQGYIFSKPIPKEEVDILLRDGVMLKR